MHYGLGTEMTTKKNLKRALVGQRYGFSKVGLNKYLIPSYDLLYYQANIYLVNTLCL